MIKKRIKKSVKHQNIGGKECIIDESVSKDLTPQYIIDICDNNWACYNFVTRRKDFDKNFPHKLYYVKVDGLGYVVAEDELEK